MKNKESKYEKKIKELNDQIIELGKATNSTEGELRAKFMQLENDLKKDYERQINEYIA